MEKCILVFVISLAYMFVILYTYRDNRRMSNFLIALNNLMLNIIWCVYSERKWIIIGFAVASVLWFVNVIMRFLDLRNAVISRMMSIPANDINTTKGIIKYSKKIIKESQAKLDENNDLSEDDLKLLKLRIEYNELIIHKKETFIYQLSQIKDQTNKISKQDAIQLVISPIAMT